MNSTTDISLHADLAMQWRSECRRRDALKTIVVQVGVQVDAYACGRFCFIKLSLLLIAIEARSDDGLETSISINPQGHDLRLDSNSQGFFIAESADDVKRYTAVTHIHTHTHTHPFNGPFSGTTRVSQYQKGKPVWVLLKQETVSGSGISWAICKSAPRSRQISMPASHPPLGFLQAGCPSCRPTNSVKALKAKQQ